MEEHSSPCVCSGIRFCAKCRDTLRVQQLFSGSVFLSSASSVIDKQWHNDRLSSCSFAIIGKSTLSYCIECMTIFKSEAPIKSCVDHQGAISTSIVISGLVVFQDVLTEEEETALIYYLDNSHPFPPWKESQSGRRKQEYGPKRNFKKKKVRPAEIPAMPLALEPVCATISSTTENFTGRAYRIAEVSALEYVEGKMSNFDPHIDDTWLWGDRIAGLNLNEPCVVTFVEPDGVCCDVYLPRRSFFLMSGNCRYKWMHGIRPEHVRGRRISLTFRELSDEILADAETSEVVLSAASTFV
ncbi:putative 2OG-Fe(II) oxygenase superfamily [Leishmania utingensis]|uniref:2OG-Fe(II) oxygenase superfamily n=1 Tax=Leishmania utingensis TaxID=653362 RepID=A0AAW2ZUV5_9TRYP